jgi:hypothetical protein
VADRGRLLKYGGFLLCWSLSICLLIVFSANNGLSTLHNQIEKYNFGSTLPENQVGAFSYIRVDPKENYRPIYSVAFENLLVENNRLGIFKTAINRKATIRSLKLRLYHYIPADTSISKLLQNAKELIKEEVATKLTDTMDGWHISNINFAKVSEVCVNNFDGKIFQENNLLLAVNCKRAIVSYRAPNNIVLRGHVIISTGEGDTLESNYIEWDTKNCCFRTDKTYFLNRNGEKTSGKGICVDSKLNTV